jgi:hypothetical protein
MLKSFANFQKEWCTFGKKKKCLKKKDYPLSKLIALKMQKKLIHVKL